MFDQDGLFVLRVNLIDVASYRDKDHGISIRNLVKTRLKAVRDIRI